MIEIKNLSKTFKTQGGEVAALKNVNLNINDGDIYGIIGMSGAGKSTLVRCINMLERPSVGSVIIDGKDICLMNERELRAVRRKVTMIFQSFNLLMQRNCLDNICFPLELSGTSKKEAQKRAAELLKIVGLPDKALNYPAQLSGGQQQRIAIARALATNPEILLCDEATSALDPKTTASILELIKEINKKTGITVIVITHQMSVVEKICDRVAILDGGVVAEEGAVSEVFANPKSDAAKHLVYSDAQPLSAQGATNVLRITYNGSEAASAPIIAKMAMEEKIAANILGARTKLIGEKVYGSMLLGIEGGKSEYERAAKYLESIPNVSVGREE